MLPGQAPGAIEHSFGEIDGISAASDVSPRLDMPARAVSKIVLLSSGPYPVFSTGKLVSGGRLRHQPDVLTIDLGKLVEPRAYFANVIPSVDDKLELAAVP